MPPPDEDREQQLVFKVVRSTAELIEQDFERISTDDGINGGELARRQRPIVAREKYYRSC